MATKYIAALFCLYGLSIAQSIKISGTQVCIASRLSSIVICYYHLPFIEILYWRRIRQQVVSILNMCDCVFLGI